MEITLRIDEIDYGALAETLLPLVRGRLSREEGGFLAALASLPPAMVRPALAAMPREAKDELIIRLINSNRDLILEEGTRRLIQAGVPVKLGDITAKG